MDDIGISTHTGGAARPFLNEIAQLRISVFREFPYLYDGSLDYEMEYLWKYFASEKNLIVRAKSGSDIVGASTGIPLAEADSEFRDPVVAAGIDPRDVFFFGESVLLQEFRSRGIGHQFFDQREMHAAQLGFLSAGFFSVIRSLDHPLKPAGYLPHDGFWQKRGYARQNGIIASFP